MIRGSARSGWRTTAWGSRKSSAPRVFQKGFRAHPELGFGTGLGLHLVEQAVAERGGTVELLSQEGKGTRVVVRVRSLNPQNDALTADLFRVERLMGESLRERLGDEGPGLPEDLRKQAGLDEES